MPTAFCPENQKQNNTMAAEKNGLSMCLVHGSFHGAWCWELLRPELEKLGYDTEAMDLPIDDPSADYGMYADIVAEYISDAPNTVVIGHSRMGNVLPMVASRKAVRQIIYFCAGFDQSNDVALRHHFWETMPPKYDRRFLNGIIADDESQMSKYDPDIALEVLYHDCPPEIALAAAAHLRPMFRPTVQPKVNYWPEVAAGFIRAGDDRVIRPEYSEYISRSEKIARHLGGRAIMLDGGHSLHLSKPAELAKAIDSITIKGAVPRTSP